MVEPVHAPAGRRPLLLPQRDVHAARAGDLPAGQHAGQGHRGEHRHHQPAERRRSSSRRRSAGRCRWADRGVGGSRRQAGCRRTHRRTGGHQRRRAGHDHDQRRGQYSFNQLSGPAANPEDASGVSGTGRLQRGPGPAVRLDADLGRSLDDRNQPGRRERDGSEFSRIARGQEPDPAAVVGCVARRVHDCDGAGLGARRFVRRHERSARLAPHLTGNGPSRRRGRRSGAGARMHRPRSGRVWLLQPVCRFTGTGLPGRIP